MARRPLGPLAWVLALALGGRASLQGGPTFGKRRGFLLRRGEASLEQLPFAFGRAS